MKKNIKLNFEGVWLDGSSLNLKQDVPQSEGVFTAKMVNFQSGTIKLRVCVNNVFLVLVKYTLVCRVSVLAVRHTIMCLDMYLSISHILIPHSIIITLE